MQVKPKLNLALMATAAALTGVFALSAVKPAEAQRKSIRWATSSVDSYGYKVAASMTKMVEEALGGEYTVTVNPYPQTTGAGKAAMDGNAEIGYTADIGMREIYDQTSGFKGYKPGKGPLVHTWYAYPMESFMATTVGARRQVEVPEGLQRPAGVLHAGRLHELAELPAHVPDARYNFKHVQIDPKTQSDALQAGTIVGSVAYTVSGTLARAVLEGNRNPHGHARRQSVPGRSRQAQERRPFGRVGRSEGRLRQGRRRRARSSACRSCSPTTCAPTCRRTSSTGCSTRSTRTATSSLPVDSGFSALAKDFIGMQVAGINANPDIPVHPGLAKLLKEHKAWNDKWKVAGSGS